MYYILNNIEDILATLKKLEKRDILVFDTETTGLDTHSGGFKLVGLGFDDLTDSYYIPLNIEEGSYYNLILDASKNILENENIGKIGQNIKYDARACHSQGINIKNIIFDTYVAHYCLVSDRYPHNLDDLSLHYLGIVKTRTKTLIPKKKKGEIPKTMWDADIEAVGSYCCEDIETTRKLYQIFKNLLKENKAAYKLFYELELPLLPVLIDMECTGVELDIDHLVKLKDKIITKIAIYEKFIEKKLGHPLKISNPNEVSTALYDELQVQEDDEVPLTAKGKRKTSKDALALYSEDTVVRAIQQIKKYQKLLNTYIIALMRGIFDKTGKLHASFNQCIVSTGRLSSSNPNLQNIPQKDKFGRLIRKSFISRFRGGSILAADYSQAELRILADNSGDKTLLEAYLNNEDVHGKVVESMNSDPELKALGVIIDRPTAKIINFGIIYGMRASKLSMELNIDFGLAKKIVDKYMEALPGVSKFIEDSEQFLVKHGYCETFFGRRRYIPKVYSSDPKVVMAAKREGVNSIIQGGNADIMKSVMIQISEKIKQLNLKSLLILQVHDEVVFDIFPGEESKMLSLVKGTMENVVKFKVPMIAECKLSSNWSEAH